MTRLECIEATAEVIRLFSIGELKSPASAIYEIDTILAEQNPHYESPLEYVAALDGGTQ